MYACKRNLHPSYVTAMLAIQKKDKEASDLSMCGENASLIIIFDDPPNVFPWMHIFKLCLCTMRLQEEKIYIIAWIIHNLVI